MSRFFAKVAHELGLSAMAHSPSDVHKLIASRAVRMSAYGASTLILALFLSDLGISDTKIGLFMTLTLLGDVGISLILTMIADAIGRRRMLMLGAALMTVSGVIFATVSEYWVLVVASVVGVISPR